MRIKKFTLIEMLVVIAILGILISMLLPALSKVRAKAKLAVCISQLSQINIASYNYLDDNNYYYWDGRTTNGIMQSSVFSYLGKSGSSNPYDLATADTRRLNRYFMNEVLPESEVPIAECPSDFGMKGNDAYPSFYNKYGACYSSNVLTSIPDNGVMDKNLNEIVNPVKCVVAAEHGAIFQARGLKDNKLLWHNRLNFYNALFVDGHVKFTRFHFNQIDVEDYTFVHDSE
jgi:prepilin-type N-terminal cleavage/methylation domain-containing protein/prepilin-type processing-associated H-X9-DG protein